jgi:hypothetical protein
VQTVDKEKDFLEVLEGIGGKKVQSLPKLDDAATVVVEEGSKDRPSTATTAAAPAENVTPKNLWRHPDAHPIALDLLLLRKYGPDWLGWEPETLQLLIPEDFNTPSLSDLNLSKLQACKALHLVDTFWQQWEIFIACLMPFNSEFPDFNVMQVPTVAQCLVACDIAARIRDDVQWSDEMKAYMGVVYQHDGIFLPLPPADFMDLEAPEEIDQKKLAVRWNEVRSAGKAPTGDTPMDEQLRRLLIVNGFLEESRARLTHQLRFHV